MLGRVNRPVRPVGVAGPAAAYELAVVTDPGSRLLHTAGIVGSRPDGSVADEVGEQASEAWRTITAVLAEAGFEATDVISYTTYLVAGEDPVQVMTVRDAFFDGHTAASTLVVVPALARPEWKVEIAVIAARAE
jgi:2-iminobutanoate/2-iminopropanoate deaminase